MSITPPLAGSRTWTKVMARAKYQCQCEGACGRPHTKSGGRCPQVHNHYTRHDGNAYLIAAPRTYVASPVAAATIDTDELRAWCTACHDGMRRAHQREAAAVPDDTAPLFGDVA